MLLRLGASLLLLLACSSPPPTDAGTDAGRDAGYDAGRDAGPRDAGHDASRDASPDDPMWVPWVTLGPCAFERATNPSAVLSVGWESCERFPACQRPVGHRGLHGSTGWFDRGTGYIEFTELEGTRRFTYTLVSVDGPTLAAWRYVRAAEGACLFALGIGDGHVAIVPSYTYSERPEISVQHVYHGPIERVAELSEPVSVLRPGVLAQHVAVSAEVIAFWTGAWAVAVDPATGRVVYLNEPLGGIPQRVQVVGSHVLWEDWADLVRVAHADLDTPATIFRRADPGDIKGFRTDGIDFAWFEGYDRQPDGSYDRLELWTAPYTRDAGSLAPRRVRAMEERGGSMYGGGWYVVQRGAADGFDIVNVRDGTLRRHDGNGASMPLYVSETEILFDLYRIDPNALPLVE